MAEEPKRTGRTTIDWKNIKKETTIIDRQGNMVNLPRRRKTLQDLADRRAAMRGMGR